MNNIFGIDTIEIVANKRLINAYNSLFVPTHYLDSVRTKYVMNPDFINGGITVEKYSDYMSLIGEALQVAGIEAPVIRRIDFRVDNFVDEYEKHYKLHKFMILCLAMSYHNIQSYESYDPVTQDILCIRAQGKYWEAEYYNKLKQEPKSGIKSRFEMRAKAGSYHVGDERRYFDLYSERLIKITSKQYLLNVAEYLNDYLNDKWEQEKKNISKRGFLEKYSDNIFMKEQAIGLCNMLGYKDPKQTASKLDIKYISHKELSLYVNELITLGDRFFES
ncbi:hypothetical protein [Ruminococcus albus]|uniref:Uncharacterized protein n=1 Tax=Ruminococcus albus TaxID=1264 RepID=A0A1H7Q271_RUMAL|nr:hypothetical protein [Ruminococcus albus]SEL41926.1 hypothetical protein SAMN05216469_1289 [Ruminococcus albus]